jgi:hypothetical protein
MNTQKHIRFDWAIKKILRNKANFEILEGFLSELFREDVKIQNILESESNKEHAEDKSNRVDILVQNSKNELILVEVQNEREHDYFHRMAFGTSKLITQYLNQGEPYSEIKKVYSINIVYFDLGHGQDYVYEGRTQFVGIHKNDILEPSSIQVNLFDIKSPSDVFPTYYVLKLNSFDDIAKDSLDEWIYFLKNSEIKDEFNAKGIQKAKETLRIDSLSPSEKFDYEQYIKDDRIRRSEIVSAIQDERAKLIPQIEEAKAREEEAKAREEEAKAREENAKAREIEERRLRENLLSRAVIGMYSKNQSIEEIATILSISTHEINNIIEIWKQKR